LARRFYQFPFGKPKAVVGSGALDELKLVRIGRVRVFYWRLARVVFFDQRRLARRFYWGG
jgi:hypothetical protein